MRVAVALPDLPAEAPLRQALDAVIGALLERGADVEAFAEMRRVREGGDVPLFHYLRFPERHRHRAFDRGLWPVGRDLRPWEAAWTLACRFPGTVWVLDGPLHHVALGGIAVPGHWGLYGRLVERTRGVDADRAFSLFAAGWGTRATVRTLDPVAPLLGDQDTVIAANEALGAWLRVAGGPVAPGAVPLPPVVPPSATPTPPDDAAVATVVSVDVVQPRLLLEGIAEVLAAHPDLDLRVALPEPTYHVRVAPAAHATGILDRVTWLLSPGPGELLRRVTDSTFVLLLDIDVTAADRALLEHALALGRTAIALDVPVLRDVPDPPLVKLRPGRALGPSLAVALRELLSAPDLRRALAAAGRRWAAERPGPAALADRLLGHLREAPSSRGRPGHDKRDLWGDVRGRMLETLVPAAAGPTVEATVAEVVESVLPAAARALSSEP